MCSGAGNDSIQGGEGDDRLFTGGGNQAKAGNIAKGSGGDDYLLGGRVEDQFDGGAGDDTLVGRGGPDAFIGGTGGRNRMIGGSSGGGLYGDLVEYDGSHRAVKVNLSKGHGHATGRGRELLTGVEDVVAYGPARLIGNAAPNILSSGSSADFVFGRGGDDCLMPGHGENSVWGGPGFDSYSENLSHDCAPDEFPGDTTITSGVEVDLANGTAEYGGVTTKLHGVEGAYGTSQRDRLLGDDGANLLEGAGGNDEIAGRAGDDRLDGRRGTDTLDGGEGTDSCLNGEVVTSCE